MVRRGAALVEEWKAETRCRPNALVFRYQAVGALQKFENMANARQISGKTCTYRPFNFQGRETSCWNGPSCLECYNNNGNLGSTSISTKRWRIKYLAQLEGLGFAREGLMCRHLSPFRGLHLPQVPAAEYAYQ
jgi:hypothetical protein